MIDQKSCPLRYERHCVVCGCAFVDDVGYRAICSEACDQQWEQESKQIFNAYLTSLVPRVLDVLGLQSLEEYQESIELSGNDPGFVYFVQAEEGGAIKIGYSIDPLRRYEELQKGSPVRLAFLGKKLGNLSNERAIHRSFAEHRLHGEWFAPHKDLLGFINEACAM